MASRAKSAGRKHIPQRSCVVCRQVRSKRELIRIVHNEVQGLALDPVGKAPGRGAYLCDRRRCWEQAARTDILGKALKITMSAQDRDLIRSHGQSLPEKEYTDM